jgi:hypothetical protein
MGRLSRFAFYPREGEGRIADDTPVYPLLEIGENVGELCHGFQAFRSSRGHGCRRRRPASRRRRYLHQTGPPALRKEGDRSIRGRHIPFTSCDTLGYLS